MLIHIGENTYNATDALREANLNDLYYLKMKTTDELHPNGISIETLRKYLTQLGSLESGAEIVDDVQALMGLRGLVYLARRRAGERISVEDACDFPLSQLRFEKEESDAILIEEASKRPFRTGRRASRRAAARRAG